jgi:hypothetical protein
MIWEAYQQNKIAEAAETTQSGPGRVADDLAATRRHVDRLALACQAMWEIMRDRSNLLEQDIEAKMLEIDARDGRLDGKITTQVLKCSSCGSTTNSKRFSCVICGTVIERPSKFEG